METSEPGLAEGEPNGGRRRLRLSKREGEAPARDYRLATPAPRAGSARRRQQLGGRSTFEISAKKKVFDQGATRTRNLLRRKQTRYPLRYTAKVTPGSENKKKLFFQT